MTGVGVAPILARAAVALPLRRPYSAPEVATGSGRDGRRGSVFAGRHRLRVAVWPADHRPGRAAGRSAHLAWRRSRRAVECLYHRARARSRDALRFLPRLCRGRGRRGRSGPGRAASSTRPLIAPRRRPRMIRSVRSFPSRARFEVDRPGGRSAPLERAAVPIETGCRRPRERTRDEPVAWNSGMAAPEKTPERFGGGALVAALIVGMVVGFAAGYMARPRALQSAPPREMASARRNRCRRRARCLKHRAPPVAGTERARQAGTKASASARGELRATAHRAAAAPAAKAPAPRHRTAPSSVGQLVSPLDPERRDCQRRWRGSRRDAAGLRDLALGSRTVVVARRGYIVEDQRVVLTSARPSRSLEVRLARGSRPRPPPPRRSRRRRGHAAAAATASAAAGVDRQRSRSSRGRPARR